MTPKPVTISSASKRNLCSKDILSFCRFSATLLLLGLAAAAMLATFPALPAQAQQEVVVDESGNVGVGTSSPAAQLEVKGGAFLIDGNTGKVPVEGKGTRLMFIPGKRGAFRAGEDYSGDAWDADSIGRWSVAMGLDPLASGEFGSVALGRGPAATGENAVAIGRTTKASGKNAVSIGHGGGASGRNATTIGLDAVASAEESITIGTGIYLEAGKLTNDIPESIMFGINAVPTMLVKEGQVGIGTTTPSEALEVDGTVLAQNVQEASSRRWKKDIRTLKNALGLVGKLRGVRYSWKDTGAQGVGLIAEEVGEVLPELVTYEDNGQDARAVSYAHLVPVLVEALKQQQTQIEDLRQIVRQRRAERE